MESEIVPYGDKYALVIDKGLLVPLGWEVGTKVDVSTDGNRSGSLQRARQQDRTRNNRGLEGLSRKWINSTDQFLSGWLSEAEVNRSRIANAGSGSLQAQACGNNSVV